MFIHTVYFSLSDVACAEIESRMREDCHVLLSQIPSARHVWAGTPAMTPRELVDNSYTIGLCVALDDAAAHDDYQAHALHHEFLARYKQYWKKVQIYDFK